MRVCSFELLLSVSRVNYYTEQELAKPLYPSPMQVCGKVEMKLPTLIRNMM